MLPLFLFMHMVFFHIGRSYAILSTHVSTRKDFFLGGGCVLVETLFLRPAIKFHLITLAFLYLLVRDPLQSPCIEVTLGYDMTSASSHSFSYVMGPAIPYVGDGVEFVVQP